MARVIVVLTAMAGCLSVAEELTAQVIQLPTYRYFSVGTSVLVPDRGSAYLGGVGHAAYGSSQRGPFNRSHGSSIGSAGISVHATIIDQDEIDRALLAEAAARRGASHDVLGRPVGNFDSRHGAIAAGKAEQIPSESTKEEAIRRKAAFLSKHVGRNNR